MIISTIEVTQNKNFSDFCLKKEKTLGLLITSIAKNTSSPTACISCYLRVITQFFNHLISKRSPQNILRLVQLNVLILATVNTVRWQFKYFRIVQKKLFSPLPLLFPKNLFRSIWKFSNCHLTGLVLFEHSLHTRNVALHIFEDTLYLNVL